MGVSTWLMACCTRRSTTVGIPNRRILPLSLGISTLFTRFKQAFVHYTTSEIFVYKTDYSAVFYRTAENFYEFAMDHGIEEAFKVKVYYIYVAFVDYPLRSS